MNLLASIGICFIPLILLTAILLAFIKKFRVLHAFFGILLGLIAIVPIAIIQLIVLRLPVFSSATMISLLVTTFIFNGLIEETIKMICLFLLPGKKMDLSDFICSSFIAGISLATFEAVIYLIGGSQDIGLRLFTAVFIHGFCAALSGIYVWTFKHKQAKIGPFVLAVFLHGLYNFFAGLSGSLWWFSIICIIYAAIRVKFYYSRLTSTE